MRWIPLCVLLCAMLALGCSGKTGAGASTPSGGSSTGSEMGSSGDPELDAAPAVPCETSDDCASSQICVDDECVVPVPAGFY